MGVRSWQQWRAIVTRSNISSICSIPELEILYQLRSSAIMLVSCDLCPRLYKYTRAKVCRTQEVPGHGSSFVNQVRPAHDENTLKTIPRHAQSRGKTSPL